MPEFHLADSFIDKLIYTISQGKKHLITTFFVGVFSMTTYAAPINFSEVIGQFNEKKHPDFVELNQFGFKTNKPNMFLRKEAAEKLLQAYQDFQKVHPDIPFVIISAARNYDYQKAIWTRKWNTLYPKYKNDLNTAKDILRFSSMPGTSRHHWGTDIDITHLESDYFYNDPKGKVLYQWLIKNMSHYGFCQPYTPGRKGGYQKEEWHWSYQPLAASYLATYKMYLENQPNLIIQKMDFSGHNRLPLTSLINEYVFSVDKSCY